MQSQRLLRKLQYSSSKQTDQFDFIIQKLNRKLLQKKSKCKTLKQSLKKEQEFESLRKINNKNIKKKYAQDLFGQIEDKRQKEYSEMVQKRKPGISMEFNGYPHRPQTPLQQKKIKQNQKKIKFKLQLEKQIRENNQIYFQRLGKVKQIQNNLVKSDKISLKKHKKMSEIKKLDERNLLTQAWQKAIQAKKLEQMINGVVRNSPQSSLLIKNPSQTRLKFIQPVNHKRSETFLPPFRKKFKSSLTRFQNGKLMRLENY